MDRQQEFEQVFRVQVERFRQPLIEGFQRIVKVVPPARAVFIVFEIYSDWRSFQVSTFAFDRDWNEVSVGTAFHRVRLAIRGELVPDGVIDQDAFEDDGVATFESGAVLLAELFRACWSGAGGDGYPLPAYAIHHDRGRVFDLRTGEWVSTRDIPT